MSETIKSSTTDNLLTGWKITQFGDICLWSRYGLSVTADEKGRYPLLRMNNLQNGRIDLTDLVYIDLYDEEFSTHRLRKGELLVNRTNSYDLVGKTAIVNDDSDLVCASYIVRFALDTSAVEPSYINYFFNSEHGQKQLKSLATKGVSQANINPTSLKKDFLLPLPPLPEQRKIAEILSTWDDAIATVDALIAALQRRKQGLMQRLLTGQVRFAEFGDSEGMQETRFGEIPAEWGYLPIGEVAKEVSIRNSNGEDLTVLSCTKYDGLVDSLAYFGRQIYSDDTSTYKVVKRGQFAYATNHIEEGSIGYQDLYDEALISPMYTVFQTDNRIHDAYLYRILKTELYRHIFEISTSGTVDRRGSLRWNDFSRIRVPVPSLAEQRKIAEVFDGLDQEISATTGLSNILKQQKKGLMQRLLTGQVRIF